MLKHIVMWRLKPEAFGHSKEKNLAEMRVRLSMLPDLIPEIREFVFGTNVVDDPFAMDCVLVSSFDDAAALAVYQAHPEHIKVKAFIGEVCEQRTVVDAVV